MPPLKRDREEDIPPKGRFVDPYFAEKLMCGEVFETSGAENRIRHKFGIFCHLESSVRHYGCVFRSEVC